MAKPVLVAVTEYGTFKRSTFRDYKFVIASKGKFPHVLRKEHAASVAYARKLQAEYEAVVAGTRPSISKHLTVEQYAEFAAQQKLIVETLLKKTDDIVINPANDTVLWGWSGDTKNAAKVAQKAASYGYQDVRIFGVNS